MLLDRILKKVIFLIKKISILLYVCILFDSGCLDNYFFMANFEGIQKFLIHFDVNIS